MLAIVFDYWLEICFLSLVSSVQVARLACVLIGSLAKLPSSFCKRSVLAPCRWLMLSLARWSHQWLSFGFKGLLRYLPLSWFQCQEWGHTAAYYPCCIWPHQAPHGTFAIRIFEEVQLHPGFTLHLEDPIQSVPRLWNQPFWVGKQHGFIFVHKDKVAFRTTV